MDKQFNIFVFLHVFSSCFEFQYKSDSLSIYTCSSCQKNTIKTCCLKRCAHEIKHFVQGCRFAFDIEGDIPDSFFKDTLQDGYFDIILYKRQIRWSSALKHIPLCMPCAHRTPSVGAELDSITFFCLHV